MSELREDLAALCHDQWSGWMEYLFSKCEYSDGHGGVVIPAWAYERWKRQMMTPYAELSESEQNSDRTEADKFLAILAEHTP